VEKSIGCDPMQRFRQGKALEQTKPFARVPVPHEIEAVAADVVQAGKWRVEFCTQEEELSERYRVKNRYLLPCHFPSMATE
jgi:hypothetical protein